MSTATINGTVRIITNSDKSIDLWIHYAKLIVNSAILYSKLCSINDSTNYNSNKQHIPAHSNYYYYCQFPFNLPTYLELLQVISEFPEVYQR